MTKHEFDCCPDIDLTSTYLHVNNANGIHTWYYNVSPIGIPLKAVQQDNPIDRDKYNVYDYSTWPQTLIDIMVEFEAHSLLEKNLDMASAFMAKSKQYFDKLKAEHTKIYSIADLTTKKFQEIINKNIVLFENIRTDIKNEKIIAQLT